MTTALFVGRFQPFHKGHLDAVHQILQRCDDLIIGVGSSQYSGMADNPFTYEQRAEMIRNSLDQVGIEGSRYRIYPVPDINDPPNWVEHVENQIPEKFDIVFTANPETEQLFLARHYIIGRLRLNEQVSATKVREMMSRTNKMWKIFVPDFVRDYLDDIDGEGIIKGTLADSQQNI